MMPHETAGEQPSGKETLYCLGCGRAVAEVTPGQALAIACSCGAMAPILHTKDCKGIARDAGSLWTPVSLQRRLGSSLPHLEYYLGWSDHTSDLKTEALRALRAAGCISMRECEKCQKDGTLQRNLDRIAWEKKRAELSERYRNEGWSSERLMEEIKKLDDRHRS